MFCPSCGKEIPEASSSCLHCGKGTQATGGQARTQSSNKPLIWGIAAVIAVLIVVVVTTRRPSPPTPAQIAATSIPQLQPITSNLFSGELVVKPGQVVFKTFTIDASKMRWVRVVGNFHAAGGIGNDIQVVIADASEFENWRNGHKAMVLYSTDKTTNGKFDVIIGQSGSYVLAYSNLFSLLTEKQVFTEANITYLAPK